VPRLHYNDERRDRNSTNCPDKFWFLGLSGGVALLAYLQPVILVVKGYLDFVSSAEFLVDAPGR
jgi:lipid-A-disaccharide synthase-like uncharacterized protein